MRPTSAPVLALCIFIGGVLTLLSTARYDSFLAATLPGKVRVSVRRGDLLPSSNSTSLPDEPHRRQQPFKGHAIGTAGTKQQSAGIGKPADGVSGGKAAAESTKQMPGTGKQEEAESKVQLLADALHESGRRVGKLGKAAAKKAQRRRAERPVTLPEPSAHPSYLSEDAAWDYDVEAQALQMRLFDLNAIMPGALKKLDHNHVAAAAARQVSGNMSGDYVAASPQCRALIGMAIEEDEARERREREAYYASLPNLWDPKVAAEVLEAEKPKEVISRADKTPMDFPPGSEGMLGRVYTEGLQLQAHIVELGRAFVDGVRQLKLSEEEVEQIWMDAMSPGGQKLFKAHMDEVRAKRAEAARRAAEPLSDDHRIAAGMLGALCGGVRQCIVDIWNTCEQQPTCVHEIWHLRRREGLITDFEVTVGQAIAQELGRTQSQGTPGQEPKPTAPEEQPDQAIGKSTQHDMASVAHFGNETVAEGQLPEEDLKKHVQIAYEATLPTSNSTAAEGPEAAEGESEDALLETGRPWSKLDAIFAKANRQREAVMRAAAEKAEKERAASKAAVAASLEAEGAQTEGAAKDAVVVDSATEGDQEEHATEKRFTEAATEEAQSGSGKAARDETQGVRAADESLVDELITPEKALEDSTATDAAAEAAREAAQSKVAAKNAGRKAARETAIEEAAARNALKEAVAQEGHKAQTAADRSVVEALAMAERAQQEDAAKDAAMEAAAEEAQEESAADRSVVEALALAEQALDKGAAEEARKGTAGKGRLDELSGARHPVLKESDATARS